jgi:hypothetical protein
MAKDTGPRGHRLEPVPDRGELGTGMSLDEGHVLLVEVHISRAPLIRLAVAAPRRRARRA